jgi:outer membrane protein OmpA-like peptidoglycan-associated protein
MSSPDQTFTTGTAVTIFARLLMFAGIGCVLFIVAPNAFALQQCPDNFVAFRGTIQPLACSCLPDSTERGGVWGMGPYTEDSSICMAAVHAGILTSNGGDVTIVPAPGQRAYPGLTSNGVSSGNNGQSEGSFSFANVPQQAAIAAPPPAPLPTPAVSPAPAVVPATTVAPVEVAGTISQCPDNFVAFRGETQPTLCFCPPIDVNQSNVWGMDIYTEDSNVCLAAVHAGFLTSAGGNVTITALPGRQTYAGVTRNGISSSNYGSMDGSFSFTPTTQQAAYAPVQPIAQQLAPFAQCPDNFVAFRSTAEAFNCFCPPIDMNMSNVWGMDIYTEDSNICLAAVHYGVLTPQGGNVSVLPEPGRKTYAGATRNGISSSNYGSMEGSFSFSPTLVIPVAAPTPAAPIQQPIAKSLMETGQVQLYIHFATDSDKLFEDSLPTLSELLAALRSNPGISLKLIGHTDNVGSPQYNQDLSAKRAKAVKFWLIQQGVLPTRLETEGRGLTEPLDDNGTEYGRAANRRVQAIRLN